MKGKIAKEEMGVMLEGNPQNQDILAIHLCVCGACFAALNSPILSHFRYIPPFPSPSLL